MPFVSESQRRACYAQQSNALKSGKKPAWDCSKYAKGEKTKKKSKKKSNKVFTGPRGGKYIIKNNKKVYIKN